MLMHYGIQTLVDIGANVGQYALSARRAGYRERIISFEPALQPFRMLSAVSASDQNWHCERFAVGDSDGSIEMQLSEGSIFNSILTVSSTAVNASPNAVVIGSESVPLRTLDHLLERPGRGPLAIKIDVQGSKGRCSRAPRGR